MTILKYLPSGAKLLMALIGFALLAAVMVTLYAAHAPAGMPRPPVPWVEIASATILILMAILKDAPAIEAVAADIPGLVDHTVTLAKIGEDLKTAIDGLPAAVSGPIEALLPAHTAATVAAVTQAVSDGLNMASALAPASGAVSVATVVDDGVKLAQTLDPAAAQALAVAQAVIQPVLAPAGPGV
jgi:hypothetical protein